MEQLALDPILLLQQRLDGKCVGTPDLVWQRRLINPHQLIAGGNYGRSGQSGNPQNGFPNGGCRRDFCRSNLFAFCNNTIFGFSVNALKVDVLPKIDRIRQERCHAVFNVQVLISKDKSPVFQAIDLAHELVHALHPKSNPFDPKLNAVDYVRSGIESEGGEAQAILQECKVGRELVSIVTDEAAQLIKARCQYVWKTENNQDQWKLSFYHLGKYFSVFRSKLDSMNTDDDKREAIEKIVQMKDPMFTSAAANKPYPLALLDEYMEITKKICNKSQERKLASVVARAAAGNADAPIHTEMDERCQSLSSALFSP